MSVACFCIFLKNYQSTVLLAKRNLIVHWFSSQAVGV